MTTNEEPTAQVIPMPRGGLCPVCGHWTRVRDDQYVEHAAKRIWVPGMTAKVCAGSERPVWMSAADLPYPSDR